jgi:hypothetical protein
MVLKNPFSMVRFEMVTFVPAQVLNTWTWFCPFTAICDVEGP